MGNLHIFVLTKLFERDKYCGVMKFSADMPSRLEGEDHGINAA